MARWAIPRGGNHKKWGVAGGLGALGIRNFFFDQMGQFIMCQGPLWAKFDAEYKFRQSQGVHTSCSSRLRPRGFPLGWLWSCHWYFPLVWIPVRFVAFC